MTTLRAIGFYEDNAGDVWFMPIPGDANPEIVIRMHPTGDALTDCRLYRNTPRGWDEDDADDPNDVMTEEDEIAALLEGALHIATYDGALDALRLSAPEDRIGDNARSYLGFRPRIEWIQKGPLAEQLKIDRFPGHGVVIVHDEQETWSGDLDEFDAAARHEVFIDTDTGSKKALAYAHLCQEVEPLTPDNERVICACDEIGLDPAKLYH